MSGRFVPLRHKKRYNNKESPDEKICYDFIISYFISGRVVLAAVSAGVQ